MQDENITINAGGDVAFAKDQAFAQINKTITESANISGNLENKLQELSNAVKEMVNEMPEEKAKEATKDLQVLTEEATKEAPRKKWFELSAQGLIDAAKTVGSIGKPVINTTQEVLKLIAG